MCSGAWFAHDADAELPGQPNGQKSCDEHPCFCNGAPVSPEKPGQWQLSQVSELSVAAGFLPARSIDAGAGIFGHADVSLVVSAPPPSERILPLLI